MLDSLPAIYRTQDTSGHLKLLLGAFEEVLFGNDNETGTPPGIEQQIDAIPGFFSPLGDRYTGRSGLEKTPDRFLPWLATWVAFTPHALFTPEQLRVIISGISPMYARRGTRAYLEQLLKLCFPEILDVNIDDDPVQGFIIGQAKIGEDTLFGNERPFWFRTTVDVSRKGGAGTDAESLAEFEHRVRTIIDFAKPAHTAYELRLAFSARESSERYTV
jgi:phage tail-like protein